MKKILLFVMLLFVVIFTGCANIDDQPVINQSKVNEVIILIDLLPEEITLNERNQVEQIRASYDLLNNDEKALISNYETLVNAESIIEAIIAEEEAKKAEEERKNKERLDELKRVVEEFDATIPDLIADSIQLPITFESELGLVTASWSTSDPYTLTGSGHYIPAYTEKEVTIYGTFTLDGVRYPYTKDVVVAPIEFDPLPIGRTVFAYTYNTAHGFDQKAKDTIDVINHAFGSVVDGKLSVAGLHDRNALLSLRKEGIRVVLCIGGYANEAIPWSKAASTEEGRVKLAASIVEQVIKYNYDGVDVDWEYPGFYTDPSWPIRNPLDSQNYTKMMAEIKKQLKAVNPNYIFSAAVPGGTWGPERYEIGKLTQIFDFFHLMTYDLDATERATHLTALYSSGNTINKDCSVDGTVAIYTNRGEEGIRSKLVVGAAFYGRKFAGSTGMGKSATGKQSIAFHNIKRNYIDKGFSEVWDEVSQAPSLYDAANGHVFSYDNPRSLKAKSDYIIENGLAGMMFWEYGQDNTGTLIDAIYEGLKKVNN